MALPKKHRLVLSQKKITELRKTGKKIHTSFLTAYYKPSSENHFAVVVSASISKKAAVRNRLRRLLQGGLSLFLSQATKIDMMIYPKRELIEKEKEVEQEIKSLFEKV